MLRRPWRGWDDLAPMQALLARALRDTPEIAFLHPGDLAWWVGWPLQTPEQLAANITIVEDAGAVVGWHYLEPEEANEWVDPSAPDLEAVWRELDAAPDGRPALARSVREDDAGGGARLPAGSRALGPRGRRGGCRASGSRRIRADGRGHDRVHDRSARARPRRPRRPRARGHAR